MIPIQDLLKAAAGPNFKKMEIDWEGILMANWTFEGKL